MEQTATAWLIQKLRELAQYEDTHLGLGDIRLTQGLLDELGEIAQEMENKILEKEKNKAYIKGIKNTLPIF